MSTSGFFADRQGAAVLKHGIMLRYPRIFASMTGKWSKDHRVVIVDCYAGPGTYTDGSPGSPSLIAATADTLSKIRNVHGVYVEANSKSFNALRALLESTPHRFTALHGTIERHIDRVLEIAGTSPAFFFVDPFGLAMPFDDVVRVLKRAGPKTSRGPATEMLLNFSISALRREAGHVRSKKDYPAKAALIEGVDRTLGGAWWQEIARAGHTGWMDDVLEGYLERLSTACGGWAWWTFEVYDRSGGPIAYHLTFLTRRIEGIWNFNECLSGAQQDFRKFCREDGQFDFEPGLNADWILKIESRLEKLLRQGPVNVARQLDDVLGVDDMLGLAREKHIKKAAKNLYERGGTSTDVKGKRLSDVELQPP